jgi:hypothetical protein
MKFSSCAAIQLLVLSSTSFLANAFVSTPTFVTAPSRAVSQLSMESDFESAMPEKPVLSIEEQMYEKATAFIVDIEGRLGEGVEPVPELEALRKSRDNEADQFEMAIKIYELMIEQGMVYDQQPETGILTPTEFDIKGGLDIPEVKNEFAYLYKYGMNLCSSGVIDIDDMKEIVKSRLIARTGLTPEEFDSWLGY